MKRLGRTEFAQTFLGRAWPAMYLGMSVFAISSPHRLRLAESIEEELVKMATKSLEAVRINGVFSHFAWRSFLGLTSANKSTFSNFVDSLNRSSAASAPDGFWSTVIGRISYEDSDAAEVFRNFEWHANKKINAVPPGRVMEYDFHNNQFRSVE